MRHALKVSDQLPVAAHQLSLGDRIDAIVELGVATIAAERCAVAFQSTGVSTDQVACAPRGDSRWDAAVNALLAALENRLIDVGAARGAKPAREVPGSIESIDRIKLSAREIAGIASSEKIGEGHQIAAAAFIDGVISVRIVVVARVDRGLGELEASLGLMARAVLGEFALASARARARVLADSWRRERPAVGWRKARAR